MRSFFQSNKNQGTISLTNAILVCDGNSLTAGQGASNPATTSYPARLDADAAFSTVTTYNLGVGAQETQDMIDDAASQVDPLYNGAVDNILVAWEVGNDIFYNGSVSGAITRFWSYCDARRAVGFKVIIINCPPRDQATDFGDTSGQYNTKLQSANSQLADEWMSHADGYVDLAADSRFAGYNLTYYDADKIHYTDAGYQVVKDLVKAKILAL